jgi:hypothetical protein
MEIFVQSTGGITYPFDRYRAITLVRDSLMEMYLQFGHGMMAHTRELLRGWGGGGVVMSPRDLTSDQLARFSGQVRSLRVRTLVDPQCFSTEADHYRLVTHEYWENVVAKNPNEVYSGGAVTANLLKSLAELGRGLHVTEHILPGPIAAEVTDDWFAQIEAVLEEAPQHYGNDPTIATIALSANAMKDDVQVESVIERARKWHVQGFYVVAEAGTSYLVDNPVWLANLLSLVAGLKLQRKTVGVGYCSHQMLCLAASKADWIAEGTWLNVRAFPPSKFFTPDEDEISRRSTWYYCPQALSEYKIPFLDLAMTAGVLDKMKPDPALGSTFANPLFSGVPPSTVSWGEQEAFRHYLTCVHSQAGRMATQSFDAAMQDSLKLLDVAEKLLKELRAAGVYGGDRDFTDYVDVNRGALTRFERARGAQMRRNWDKL